MLSASADTEIYSENIYSDRNKNFVSSSFGRHFFSTSERLKPYFALYLSQDNKSKGNFIYNDNFFAPALGVNAFINSILSVFAELRYVQSEFKTQLGYPESDVRTGIIGNYNYIFYETQNTYRLRSDSYGEAIYTSRILNDIFFSLKSSLGAEYICLLNPQVYLEGFIKRDRLGFYYENLNEVRLGLKVSAKTESWNFNLIFNHVMGLYQGREYKDINPYPKNYSANVVMFIVSGVF